MFTVGMGRVKSVLSEVNEKPILLTSLTGSNSDLFPKILEFYVPEGSIIADVTFNKGTFWRDVDTSKYDLRATDITPSDTDPLGTDFRHLPYPDHSIDALVLDPPYMHTGSSVHAGLQKSYNNASTAALDHTGIIRLYAGGIIEAARVLKKKTGIIIIKCQDEIESKKQYWSHIEISQLLTLFGFDVKDLFVLQRTNPPMQRQEKQFHARKSHSYFLVARFRR
jgi:hypothetical protein